MRKYRRKEIRISDKGPDGLLIPLWVLTNFIQQVAPELIGGTWVVEQGAYGHGERVCGLEDSLKKNTSIVVDMRDLMSILSDESEYFFHVNLCKLEGTICLGVFDSSWLFVISEDEGLLSTIAERFKVTKLVKLKR